MSPPSKIVQGAMIGGIVAVFLHFAIRFAIRNWMILLLLWFIGSFVTSCGG